MSHKYRAAIGRESSRPASRGITTQLEPRRISRDHSSRKSNFCGKNSGFAACREMPAFLYSRQGISSPANAEGIPEHFLCAYKRGWLPGIRQEDAADSSAAKPFPSMRRSHVQHNTARVPRRTPFWPKPQKGAKALFPGHPAALMNEPPAPHRERQVAAKGGMLQTRSRPQSCGFRPPVLAAAASWSTMFRRRPAYLQ